MKGKNALRNLSFLVVLIIVTLIASGCGPTEESGTTSRVAYVAGTNKTFRWTYVQFDPPGEGIDPADHTPYAGFQGCGVSGALYEGHCFKTEGGWYKLTKVTRTSVSTSKISGDLSHDDFTRKYGAGCDFIYYADLICE